jgi:hypothetical protein
MPRVPCSRENAPRPKSPSWGRPGLALPPSVRLRPAAAKGVTLAALLHRSSTTHSCTTRDHPLTRTVPAGCRRPPRRGSSLGHGRSAGPLAGDRRERQQPARAQRRLRCAGSRFWLVGTGDRLIGTADRGGGDRVQQSSRCLPRRSREARTGSSPGSRDQHIGREARAPASVFAGASTRHGNARNR